MTETIVKLGDMDEPVLALVDHGSEINLMSKSLHLKGRWPIDVDHGWRIRAANMLPGDLYGACANVKVTIGDVCDEHNFFIQEHSSYPVILGQPYITAARMETKVLDDGSAYARVRSRDGKRAVQFLTVPTGFSGSAIIKREYDGTKEEKFSHRETFSSGFLGLTFEDSLSYMTFNEIPKWEKQYVTCIQSDLQGCNVLEPDEVISGIFEEVSYVDMMSELDEINQNRLQSGTDFVQVHFMEVYDMLLQLKQGFEEMVEVQVETKYKTVAKKIWDSSTGACLHTLGPGPWDMNANGHKKKINALAVNPFNSCQVATSGGNGDSQILLWNVNSGELTCDLNENLRSQSPGLPCMDALEFCEQSTLISGSDSSGGPAIVQIWDLQVPDIVASFPANDSYITSLKSNPNGTTVATGAGDGSVALFDIRTGGGIVRLPLGSSFEVTSVSFSSCGTYLQASSTANMTFVWDTRMLSLEAGPRPVCSPVQLADITSRKVRAMHCLSHGTPMPTSENAGQMPGFVDEGDQGVNDARWFHNKPTLVTASGNGSIAMWDMSLGDPCVRHMISHTRCVNTVAISSDDKHICSGGDDQKVVRFFSKVLKCDTSLIFSEAA
ncbi:hypothetical protein L7F22_028783 [Adiantum nelumboides]|nr:hypothetical protein [Adiantum nelumboides]